MNRFGLVLAWLVVASAATALTWSVLSSADRHVGEAPLTPVMSVGASVPSTAATFGPDETTPPTAPVQSSSTTATAVTPTTAPTTASSVTSTTTTTVPKTTTTAQAWSKMTVPSGGGVVVVGYTDTQVRLESATPAAGFTMEIEERGPAEVRVDFEGVGTGYEVRVKWEDGQLETKVETED